MTEPAWRALFREADFRRLWTAGLCVFVVRWLETLAIGVFAYNATGSAFVVAMLLMLRILPMGLFGAFLGAVAERMDRRAALLAVILSQVATSAAVALLALAGAVEVWHLALASFMNGIAWASDNPVRRAMIGQVAGLARMGVAMSVDVGTNNASRMAGPVLGGAVLAAIGLDGAFMLSVLLYIPAVVAVLRLPATPPARETAAPPVLASIAEGFGFLRREPRLVGTLLVTLLFNLFGWPFTAMIPVLGQDRLGLGPTGIGILASMDGIGAFLGAVAIALLARPGQYRAIYLGGTALYFAMLTVFALSRDPLLAGAALMLTGLGGAGFAIMQPTLVFLATPPEMRSRVLGLLSVCIGLGPAGFLLLGGLAELLGASAATAAMGLCGLAALALARPWWRRI
ncbi:MFS transporter [Roseomonas alkaliterrae]|uniref:MFS family permease n=1 Tax=Neoroseomonas alkaliterrae TaxID=1452450 RepID=A0A840Y2L3_9PROT|nr:MFS transporter [Neoroseomonas alkaliterrae]MBB5688114.1 MFS family permease [Neoroseomonas alkaliterrae]MBR0677368.1 MFS transporter [Neoroseomonas alkaliterrae]